MPTRSRPSRSPGRSAGRRKSRFPTIKPPGTLKVTDLIQGHGGRVARGDLAIVNLVGYTWSGAKHKQVISSFSS